MRLLSLLILSGGLLAVSVSEIRAAAPTIAIDAGTQVADVAHMPLGMGLSYLLDSEKFRPRATPLSDRLQELQVTTLRFPFGHLADNYLWDNDGDWGGTLTPTVASRSQQPGSWDWCTDRSGKHIRSMDFAEFIALCRKNGITTPIVTVNMLSHAYPEGPTYAFLKESAVQWVRYAKQQNFTVAFWQLGNEVEHRDYREKLPNDEYLAQYLDFRTAMKREDPAARIGPGTFAGSGGLTPTFLSPKYIDQIDFMTVHQYTYGMKSATSPEIWRDARIETLTKVTGLVKAIAQSSRPDLPVIVTEFGSTGNFDENTWFASLVFAEMCIKALPLRGIAAINFWSTHSPWKGETEGSLHLASAFQNDNALNSNAKVMRLINQNLLPAMVKTEWAVGRIRTSACVARDGKRATLFAVNRSDQPERAQFRFTGFVPGSGRTTQLTAPSMKSRTAEESPGGTVAIAGSTASVTLAPYSLTMIALEAGRGAAGQHSPTR